MDGVQQEYWREAASHALEEAGVVFTSAQIDQIGDRLAGIHQVTGEGCGMPSGPSDESEIDRVRAELRTERAKVICRVCNGNGRIGGYCGPSHRWSGPCDRCNGDGRHSP